MSDNKIMRPIRQTEMDYWNFTIDNEYDNRKNSLKSEMVLILKLFAITFPEPN